MAEFSFSSLSTQNQSNQYRNMKTHNPHRSLKLIGATFALLFAGIHASAESPAESETPERLAVLFYADWCGSCKTLDPKITAARTELEPDTRTLFVTFDLTDDPSRAQTAMLAESLGLNSIYEQYGQKTGFLLVIDAEDKSVTHKLTKTDETETIRKHLAGS
jgi:thiol-disulfide isomerase/thioredoxin